MAADFDACQPPHFIGLHCSRRSQHPIVKVRDARRPIGLDQELHIGYAQRHVTKSRPRCITAEMVSPGTGHRNVFALKGPMKLGPFQWLLRRSEPFLEGIKIGYDKTDIPVNHLNGSINRKVKLLFTGVRPHISHANVEIGVPRQS